MESMKYNPSATDNSILLVSFSLRSNRFGVKPIPSATAWEVCTKLSLTARLRFEFSQIFTVDCLEPSFNTKAIYMYEFIVLFLGDKN